MSKKLIIYCFLLFIPFAASGQDTILGPNGRVLYRMILEEDTFYLSSIEEVYIFPHRRFESKRDLRRYRRLIRNVKRAYPYALLAKETIDDINIQLQHITGEKARKEYIKEREKELFDTYEEELKKLTITQGRILIKLIDRETGDTSYDVVKEFKGSFSAFFWQALARLFGSNLKTEFDPEGEDKLMNEIVILIENGQI